MAALSDRLCECGCGQHTTLIEKTSAAQGRVKGEPNRFVYGHARGWKHPNPPPRVADEVKREGMRMRGRSNYQRNRENIRAERTAKRAENPELDRARCRNHYEANRPAARRRGSNRRAREMGAFVEPIEPLVVLERDDGMCGICREDVDPMDFHVDHIIALANGGEHSYANVQAAHPTCNLSKGWERSPR